MHVARDEHGIPYVSSYEEEARGKTPSAFDLRDKIERIEEFLFRSVSLQCKQLHPDAILPAKAGELEAGWDICCVADEEFYEVREGWQYSQEERWYGLDYLQDESRADYNKKLAVKVGELKVGDRILFMHPGESHLFRTGFACAIDPYFAMLLWDRSGMGAKKNVHRLAGVIDCTYRGEWLVSLINLSRKIHIVKASDKIIQGLITRVIEGKAAWTDELPASDRGTAGFGSTGR